MHAYFLVDADGTRRAFRYRWVALAEPAGLTPDESRFLPPQYLVSEMKQRIAREPAAWDLVFQMAEPGDPTDDMTKHWPDSRPTITAGRLVDRPRPRGPGSRRSLDVRPDEGARRHRALRRPGAALPLGVLHRVPEAAPRRGRSPRSSPSSGRRISHSGPRGGGTLVAGMPFPATRLRRLRSTPVLRDLVRETRLHASDLVLPLFVQSSAPAASRSPRCRASSA